MLSSQPTSLLLCSLCLATTRCCRPGYCQISCNRCTCCPTLANATESAGLTEFLWAVNRTAGISGIEPLNQPGLVVTLLAPNNGAMADLFAKMGEGKGVRGGTPRMLRWEGGSGTCEDQHGGGRG